MQAEKWYVIQVKEAGETAELHITYSEETDITAVGPKFRPGNKLLIGGGTKADWALISMVTGADVGFTGVVHTVTINGEQHLFQDQILYDRNGIMMSNYASLAGK